MRRRAGAAAQAALLVPGEVRHAAVGLLQAVSADGKAAQPRAGRRGRGVCEARRAGGRAVHVPRAQHQVQPARPDLQGAAAAVRGAGRRRHDSSGVPRHGQTAFRFRRGTLPRPPALRHLGRLQPQRVPSVFPAQPVADAEPDAGGKLQHDQYGGAERQPHRHGSASDLRHRHAGGAGEDRLLPRRGARGTLPPAPHPRPAWRGGLAAHQRGPRHRPRHHPRRGEAGRRLYAGRPHRERRRLRGARSRGHPPVLLLPER